MNDRLKCLKLSPCSLHTQNNRSLTRIETNHFAKLNIYLCEKLYTFQIVCVFVLNSRFKFKTNCGRDLKTFKTLTPKKKKMIIKRTLLKACNSIRFLPRKRTTRILLMENHMRHSNDMMLSACYVNMFLRSKSIPFACFIIFQWNLFLNIFRKHLYWQWLQGCCLTFFLFPFLYVTMWSESQSMRHKSFPIFFCSSDERYYIPCKYDLNITFPSVWHVLFSSFHCRRGGGRCYVSFENPITKRATFQHKFHEIFHSLPSVLQFFLLLHRNYKIKKNCITENINSSKL